MTQAPVHTSAQPANPTGLRVRPLFGGHVAVVLPAVSADQPDQPDQPDLGTLRDRLAGTVVVPSDPGWDEARQAWNLAVDQRPCAVVLAEFVDDVVATVDFARAHGLRIAAQGTGHGACSLPSLDDTILLKTSRLRWVEIDADAKRARVDAGALWADVVEPAAEQGFMVLHGSSPDVGVVGYTLGGGVGWLARSRGLAANSVTAVEMVTADGRLVWADRDTEPDLFWAIRGGGGSFGVVTALEIELLDTPDIYAGVMFWPAERAGEVLRAWRTWTDTVPDEVTSTARVLHLPDIPDVPEPMRGQSFAVVDAVFTGPESEGVDLMAPLRMLEPLLDTFAVVPATALQHLHMDPTTPVPGVGDGMFVDDLPIEAIDALVDAAQPPLMAAEIRHLGGALARPSAQHGAVGSLDAAFVVFAAGMAPTPESRVAVGGAIDQVQHALAPWESTRTYFNFSERPVDPSRLYPAETYSRLCRIKAVYDPSEMFVANHPIPPAR